jgi:hypothetical protein
MASVQPSWDLKGVSRVNRTGRKEADGMTEESGGGKVQIPKSKAQGMIKIQGSRRQHRRAVVGA